jgi:uncharacterized RDD family membrane protein YckC
MTQPPDDRPRPDQPSGEGAPENEPTVAWTPPEPESEKPADEGGVGYAAVPDEISAAQQPPAGERPPAGQQPPTSSPPEAPPGGPPPAEPPLATEPPPATEAPPPASPIISAETAQPTSSWETPAQATPPPVAPGSGWTVPATAAAMPQQEGYVIAGVGARIVAWLIDATLASIVPAALSLALIDWTAIIDQAVRQAQLGPSGRFDSTIYTIPVTLDYVLVTLIGLGIQFLYFVGFWTSRWRSTPGMIGLKMRVVDAATGGTLSITQATKRWVALGFPIAIFGLIAPLQNAVGLVQFAVLLIVFFTIVTNDRRQGMHDRWANSLVIRHVTSGNGATFAGCLVWGVMIILIGFIASALFFAAAAPSLQDYIETLPSTAP